MSQYSSSRPGPGSSMTAEDGTSIYCGRARRLLSPFFRLCGSGSVPSKSGRFSIESSFVDRSVSGSGHDRGNRVRGKNLTAAGGNDEDILGQQHDIVCLSVKYL